MGLKYDTIKFNEHSNEFIVSSENKYGIIDEKGNIKVNLVYDEISVINYSPTLYKVKNNDKYGVMNESGTLITTVTYEEIGCETEDENAIIVIPELNEEINQSIVVKNDVGYGLIDAETGETIIECDLEKIYSVLKNEKIVYEAIFLGQKVDLVQYIKAVNTIVVNM